MKSMSGLVALLCIGLVAGCERADKTAVDESVASEGKVEVAAVATALDPALAESAMNGRWMAVKQALTDGLDVNAQDEGKRTLLMFAAFNGNTEMAKLLVSTGADVNHKDVMDRTALMFAATGPYLETVSLLLAKGAEVNAIDNHENWTALMMAAAEGQTEVVNLLLANGADVSMKDTDGEDSAYFARQRGHEALAQMLEKAAASK